MRRALLVPLAAALLLAAGPTLARADTHTYLNTEDLYPRDGGGTGGPAKVYPSRIDVSGVSGTVTRVAVTLIDLESTSADDIDMVLTGPNGQQVMLMSDACGEYPDNLEDEDWTIEDAAPYYIPNGGPCPGAETATFKPSNYLGLAPEPDDLSAAGGPAPPYVNALSFFNGSSPDGAWKLYVLDDNEVGYLGFEIRAWVLTLDVEPPPSPPPSAPAATSAAAPSPASPQPTGKRAAALAKCRHKKTKRARSKCRHHARALPI
jgi:hypothetical protein